MLKRITVLPGCPIIPDFCSEGYNAILLYFSQHQHSYKNLNTAQNNYERTGLNRHTRTHTATRIIMSFKDKNILVVGGTSGIGLETANALQAKGANVITASRKKPETDTELQHITLDVLQLDNSITEQLPDVLHGLVYCPGSIKLKPFERLQLEDFRNDLELNVLGAVQVLKAVMPLLKKTDGASVVLFSTVAAQLGMPFHTSIATAKAAIQGLTVSLAAEYATSGIRFNAIAPSLTDTPLAASLLNTSEKAEAAGKRHPLGRVGTPQDMAQAALYLLSDEASWMTGQVLHLDGGMSSVKLL